LAHSRSFVIWPSMSLANGTLSITLGNIYGVRFSEATR
jgi:hypothetical protein